MSIRYLICAALGGAVTLGLFVLMETLIHAGRADVREPSQGTMLDFIKVKEEEALRRRERRLPDEPEADTAPEIPDLPEISPTRPNAPGMTAMRVSIPTAGLAGTGMAFENDADVLPLVRIEPQYPQRALQRGIEGWVLVQFAISPTGAVVDPEVIDSEPSSIFNRAAVRAVSRWKYKPRVVEGKAVPREGVQVVLTFKLEQ